jgi:hypothetical protein
MISGRRIAAAALAATISVSFAAASTSLAQSDDPSTSTPAPPEGTVQPDDGSVLQPEGGEIVHSWALAPGGSDDPNEAGNRPNLSYTVEPGTVVDDAVTLYNYGNAQLIFNIYATDAFNGETGELDFLSGTEAPTGVGSWVTFPQDIITVPAGQQATIPISISIPDNAGPGDYTGALLASNEAISTGGDQVVRLDRRTGTRLLIRVNGPLTADLAITDISTDYSPALNPLGGSATVSYVVENRGNTRLGGTAVAKVGGPFGIGEVSALPVEIPELLPGGSVTLRAELDSIPALGIARTTIDVEPSGQDLDATDVSASSSTLALPVTILLFLLALLFALLALRAYRRHQHSDTPNDDADRDDASIIDVGVVEHQPS